MPRLAMPRPGKQVRVKGGPLEFTYWPMYKSQARYGLQPNVYANNPLALIRDAIRDQCPVGARAEARAYVSQAEYFLRAAEDSDEWAAKPLLLYYGFMNLAKAYVLTRAVRTTLDQARHGLSEKLATGGRELVDAYLKAFTSPGRDGPNTFADFWTAVSGYTMTVDAAFPLPALLPQIVHGHRLWCRAADAHERFVCLRRVVITEDASSKRLWLVLQVRTADLAKRDIGHKDLLRKAGLAADFYEVGADTDPVTKEPLVQFEQAVTVSYTSRPSDKIPKLVNSFRHSLWATVTTVPPHREYYLYMAPATERTSVLPQLLSMYAVSFYLSSITRYRPQQFDSILNGDFGGQIQEFLTNPTQFLYLLASEFAEREVTRPSIV